MVYAGVATAVVVVDLLALAATDRLLGDRLNQREVTLLVLLIAVAGYGPLRTGCRPWSGGCWSAAAVTAIRWSPLWPPGWRRPAGWMTSWPS